MKTTKIDRNYFTLVHFATGLQLPGEIKRCSLTKRSIIGQEYTHDLKEPKTQAEDGLSFGG